MTFLLNNPYPEIVPKIDICNYTGISNFNVEFLSLKLNGIAQSRIGTFMCHEILVYAENFLLLSSNKQLSFMDEKFEERCCELNRADAHTLQITRQLRPLSEILYRYCSPAKTGSLYSVESLDPLRLEDGEVNKERLHASLSDSSDDDFSLHGIQFNRYSHEFKEIRQLGRGSSGYVQLCRHNLDKRYYAGKRS